MNLNLRKLQNYKIASADYHLLSFAKTKKQTILRKTFSKNHLPLPPPLYRDRDLDHEIDVRNNLNFEKMETKSKSNHSYVKRKKLSKLSNSETIVIKPGDKGKAVVILSRGHYQTIIMQH